MDGEMDAVSAAVRLPGYVYRFYQKVGAAAGVTAEQAMADALFKLAGELSLEAIEKKARRGQGFS